MKTLTHTRAAALGTAALIILLLTPMILAAGKNPPLELTLDQERTNIIFTIHASTHKSHGRVNQVRGSLAVYPRDPDRSSGRLIVEVRSLKTDSNALNDNMYEMFDADQYPEIEYRIQRIELTGEEVIDTARLEGELQIRNVTRPLSASAELVEEDNGYTVSGELQIDYRRFGLEPPTAIFGLLNVDPPVDINYTVTFVEQE